MEKEISNVPGIDKETEDTQQMVSNRMMENFEKAKKNLQEVLEKIDNFVIDEKAKDAVEKRAELANLLQQKKGLEEVMEVYEKNIKGQKEIS